MKKQLLILALLPCAVQLHAQILATYGGDYVTANTTLQGNDAAGIANNQFSPTAQRQPASGYTGPVFYAGFGVSGTPGISGTHTNVLQHATNFDPIQFGLSGGTTARTLAGVIMFNVSGWEAANQALDFSVRGAISVLTATYVSDEARLIVRSGSQYFVSTNTGSFGVGGATVSFTAAGWLPYTPEASILGAPGATVTTSLASLDAVGLYMNIVTQDNPNSSSLRPQIYELSVTAVPEPATYAALLGLLALGFVVARRRR